MKLTGLDAGLHKLSNVVDGFVASGIGQPAGRDIVKHPDPERVTRAVGKYLFEGQWQQPSPSTPAAAAGRRWGWRSR